MRLLLTCSGTVARLRTCKKPEAMQVVRVYAREVEFDRVSGMAAGTGLSFSSTLYISSSKSHFTLNKSTIYDIPTSFS